jgi:hypothetical protein
MRLTTAESVSGIHREIPDPLPSLVRTLVFLIDFHPTLD